MKRNNYLTTSLIFFILLFFIHDIEASDSFIKENTTTDSLIIKNRSSDKTKVITKGQLIKVWIVDHEPVYGIFQSKEGDNIILSSKEGTNGISLNTIYKIQVQPAENKKVLGWLFVSLAIAIFLIAGWGAIVASAFGDPSAGILILLLFSIPGVGALLLGNKIKGRKYNMFKTWYFLK